jgi:hypothetical protein
MVKKTEKELALLISEQSKKIELLEKQLKTQNARLVNMMEKFDGIENINVLMEEILYTLSQQSQQNSNISAASNHSEMSELRNIFQNKFPFDVN